MRVVGIIAEYDPFHRGHRYHLEQALSLTGAGACVAVISGPVTQRGEAALWDKWTRARMAVQNGVDLVLELPFAFACNSAEEFARGGVSILNGLGCVTDLVFGCESDPRRVIDGARRSAQEDGEFRAALRQGLAEGLTYPAARSRALLRFCPESQRDGSWDKPNDILGAEYVRQLVLQGSAIVPHGVRRQGDYHDERIWEAAGQAGQSSGGAAVRFSSAAALRLSWERGRRDQVEAAVPPETMAILKEDQERKKGSLDSMILYRLLQLEPEGLGRVCGCGEGLEYRLWKALPQAKNVEELLRLSVSRRYPTARLRRLLMSALVGLSAQRFALLKEAAAEGKLYARVLGCNEQGARLLRQSKERGAIPIYTNLSRQLSEEEKRWVRGERTIPEGETAPVFHSLRLDVRAADILRLGRGEALYDGSDFVKAPYIGHKNEKTTKSP